MLSDQQAMVQESVRDYMNDRIAPIVSEASRNELARDEALDHIVELGEQLGLGPAAEGIFTSMRSPTEFIVAAEEISRVWPSLTMTLISCFPVDLLRWASSETYNAYADQLKSGRLIGSLAVTEPDAGSDTTRPSTTAKRDGDEYVLNGEKTWVSSAPIADMALTVAYDVQEDERTFFVVDRKVSGFETQSIDKLGWKASPTGQIFFRDCRVPLENKADHIFMKIIDESDELEGTFLSVDRLLNQDKPLNVIFSFLRSCMAAIATGISQAAFDMALEHCQSRETFNQPIAQHQLVQDKLFEMKSSVETSRLLALRAARLVEEADPDARMAASLAKGHASENSVEVTSDAIQLFGADGLSTELPLERFHRDARTMTIPDGTTEIQKLVTGYELTGHSAYR